MQIKKYMVLNLSGGMDSSTLLLNALEQGYDVTAISFNYGQKHSLELVRAKQLIEYINASALSQQEGGEEILFYPVTHQIITIAGLSSLLNSTLVEGGAEVPEGHYEQENMKDTVVPNRNKIFSSIAQAIALSIANKTGAECLIGMGIHSGDHAIYPDCRQEFRDADFTAFVLGNWDTEKVEMYTPYLQSTKFDILMDGVICCRALGLDFNEVYKRTNTSYKPVKVISCLDTILSYEEHSDYKSASSVERIEAFIKLGKPDPVQYADETGLVSWEVAKNHVLGVLESRA